MAEGQVMPRFTNPWALHFQKLGLELKCPLCLNLFNNATLLPCNHIFCNFCVPKSTQFGSECPACKHQYHDREIRPAPYMENIVAIYRILDATFGTTVLQPSSSQQSPLSFVAANDGNGVKNEPCEAPKKVKYGGEVSSLRANDCNHGSLNLCGKDQLGSTGKADKCVISSFEGAVSHSELETVEIDMNHVPRVSPDSSPSLGNIKNVVGNICDSGSTDSSMLKSIAKRSVEYLLDVDEGDTTDDPVQKDSFCAKRLKILNYSPSEAVVLKNCYAQEKSPYSDHMAISQCSSRQHGHDENHSLVKSTTVSDSLGLYRSVCAFCHSSKITEGTGTMTYYANGKEVDGDLRMHLDVIPVHSKCIEWTPRVFFEGEAIKNLESELGRASKLKCSSCGKKGAALGCFAKSCRKSYHVPCAFEIKECKWDSEDFLMLCPSHNYFKFPREKSKSRTLASGMKHPLSTESNQITSAESEFWTSSPCGRQEWVFCGSALSSEEKYLLVKFAAMCGATVSKLWRPNVTHVIAATDEKGACTRTLKVLMAILNGRWILTMAWIKACVEANHPVNEEPYEVSLDNHGCHDGPKTGRLRVLNNAPKLFDGLKFYFSGEFLPAYKVDLLDLVRTAGGTIIESMEQLMESHDVLAISTALLVVYNREPPRGCVVGNENSVVLQRLAEAEYVANVTNSLVIRHTWILESIAGGKLLPFVR